MIRERSDQQVRFSARQLDAAVAAGLTGEQMVTLVAARDVWHRTGSIREILLTPDLVDAASHPAAYQWDAVFVRAMRRVLGKLSDPRPNVRP
jgi:hypothetical protein